MAEGVIEFTVKNCSQTYASKLEKDYGTKPEYDPESKTCVFRIKTVHVAVQQEVADVQNRHSIPPDSVVNRASLKALEKKYVECAMLFVQWKESRKTLITILKNRAQKLGKYYFFGSYMRVITSSLNLVSNIRYYIRPYLPSWSRAFVENASVIRWFSQLVGQTLSKKLYFDIKIAIEEDKTNFNSMMERFKDHEEFSSIQNLFPYGIKEDLIVQVEKCSAESGNISNIFLSIVFSEIKDISIFKDKGFHKVIGNLLTSETRMELIKKILFNKNQANKENKLSSIGDDVLNIVKRDNNDADIAEKSENNGNSKAKVGENSKSNGTKEDKNIDPSKLFIFKMMCKACRNGLDMYSAVSDIWNNEISHESGKLRMIELMANMELEVVKDQFREIELLGIKIDPGLKQKIYQA